MSLRIENIEKRFGAFAALDGVSLESPKGEFLALVGPSGSGKTTLLRILAGLEFPEGGQVSFDGEDLLALDARSRRVGMVFQHYALFKHMTVADNIAFGLSVRSRATRPTGDAIRARVEELLRLVQIEGLGKRYPSQISGGQRQRVALARALAIEPRMLLLDEPFGALDAKVRKDLRRWLRGVHEQTGVTTVFVTHDQEEALDLADRVAVLNKGRLEQIGAPAHVYDNPRSAFVAEFIGGGSKFQGNSTARGFETQGLVWEARGLQGYTGPAIAYVRPHDFAVLGPGEPGLPVTVAEVLTAGPMVRLDCRTSEGALIEVAVAKDGAIPERGAAITLSPRKVMAFPA
jgi:sulfate transport system ATP-binding protein